MWSFLKPIPLYVLFSINKIEVIRLDQRKSITLIADDNFSSSRLVLANFEKAEIHLRKCIKALIHKKFIAPPVTMLIQVCDLFEGGLSSVERRAFIDSGEHAGAVGVKVIYGNRKLSQEEALKLLKTPQKEIKDTPV